jgi:NADH-quinone oxidoreductase subunit L
MNENFHLWLIPMLPFAGFLLNGLFGSRLSKPVVTAIAILASLGSLLVVLADFGTSFRPDVLPHVETYGHWITAGTLHIDFSFVLDQLSLVMLLIITGVGFLIHIYSVGYMHDDPGYARYFAYMNLFMFFMTVLVLAGNALLLFVGWEGVGLASYLLIGFWFQKTSAASAGKKAFIVNRIGDFGFLIGLFLLLANFGTLTFSEIAAKLAANPAWTGGVLTAIALCLFVGATGKSAQLPLYVWLPDAMEGPTPVSALIHAATMVTAGVYIVVRMHFLFDRSPFALGVVAIVGGATAVFAALIALVQNDIKRVLAYSTISQLGYMFLGCGAAAYSTAIFHLMTHAFFKALFFLAAGSVIHALGGEQDLRKMGGLRKKIPITFWTMTAPVLAITGLPPFSGFFSKDAILYEDFLEGAAGKTLWFVGLVAALLTSFYIFRLWYLAFWGESRNPEAHPHESPWTMLGPLVVLSLLSLVGGWLGIQRFAAYLRPSDGPIPEGGSMTLEFILSFLAVGVAVLGWYIAYLLYQRRQELPKQLAASFPRVYKLLKNKFYIDEIYSHFIVHPLLALSKYLLEWVVDVVILGGLAWLLGGVAMLGGAILQRWQSGNLRSYAAWLALGAAVLLVFALAPYVFGTSLIGIFGVGH